MSERTCAAVARLARRQRLRMWSGHVSAEQKSLQANRTTVNKTPTTHAEPRALCVLNSPDRKSEAIPQTEHTTRVQTQTTQNRAHSAPGQSLHGDVVRGFEFFVFGVHLSQLLNKHSHCLFLNKTNKRCVVTQTRANSQHTDLACKLRLPLPLLRF